MEDTRRDNVERFARPVTIKWTDLFGREHTFSDHDAHHIQKTYAALFLMYVSGKIRALTVYS